MILNPSSELKSIFKYRCSIYETDYTENIFESICANLDYYYKMDCSNNLDNAVCETFMTNDNFDISRTEFINLYESEDLNLQPELNKYTAIGYFLPKGFQFINKKANCYGKDFYILSLFYKNNILCMQTAKQIYKKSLDYDFNFNSTNREHLLTPFSSVDDTVHIKSIEIDGQNIDAISGTNFGSPCVYGYLLYKYYCLLGFKWAKQDNKYIDIWEESFESISEIPLPINNLLLKFLYKVNKYPLSIPITISVGECEKDTRIYYIDPEDNQERFFYLDALELLDINKSVKEQYQELKKTRDDISDEQIDEIMNAFKEKCPLDKRILTVIYESPFETSTPKHKFPHFDFHLKSYLDSSIAQNSSSFLYFGVGDCEDIGKNGCYKHIAVLSNTPVDLDFSQELEIEVVAITKTPSQQEPLLINL